MDLSWMNGAVHVAGPDTRAFLAPMAAGEVVVGLRFRPGAAPGVLGLPAYALRNQRVGLADLWPGTAVPQRIAEARALHRRCRDAFGYGPSVLRRILRFRTALRLAGQGVPFAATAARAGYADQAHLAREVRALAGAPLGQLAG